MSNRRYRVCKKRKTCKRRKQCTRKQRTRKQRTRKQRTHKQRTHNKKHVTWGGNYTTDFTSTTLENIPTKSLHRFTAVVPGYPVMSGQTYKQLMESIDRNGTDI
jgi:protoheme ferro-lyase